MSTWSGPTLPTGTLTFLFTDVEGSTWLWEEHPQAMRAVMARHDALLTGVFAQHDGVVVRPRGEGDSLFAVFVRASDAVAAALAGQRALAAEDWGEIGPLRVRMGLHTGEADLREGDYYGSAVNRCARIRAAGHGGQILISEATAKLVRGGLPAGATLLDLGRHRLKDLAEPELLFQLTASGLADSFPPLNTLENRSHNLPIQLTSFIGRERELAEITSLVQRHRLATLTGPGGTGKTRLALAVAAEVLEGFPDGVFFVDLAPLVDPTLVSSAIAQVFGVQGLPETPLRDRVLRFLRDKRLLLLLDNYEHLLAAAEFAGALLQAAPGVSVLTTSRAPLRIPGEREYPIAPLPLLTQPDGSYTAIAQNPAARLFVARAQGVRPDFALTEENAAAVAAICVQLDGLPLAIELAAARVRALPPAALLARLERRLPLLTGGARTAPARQQTLRDAIAWSYALLEPAEQRLFRRLAVFAGGCTLELAEAVCDASGDLGLNVLEGISSLLEKSLLQEVEGVDGEPRYRMLETIREFALGELEASGEADVARRQLAVQTLQLARRYVAANDWAQMDAELDNARAVLGWCVARAELAVGANLFWALRGYLFHRGREKELAEWRQRLLALPEAAQPNIARARLLTQLPRYLLSIEEQEKAAAELDEAIGLGRELGDTSCLVGALNSLTLLRHFQGKHQAVVSTAEEALTLYLGEGDAQGAAAMHFFLILAAVERGDLATAERLVAANRALAATGRSAAGLTGEAMLAEAQGDYTRARLFMEEVVRKSVADIGENSPDSLVHLARLARVMLRQGDTQAAVATCGASLVVQRRVGPLRYLAAALNVLAEAAERCGLPVASTRLLAAVAVQRRKSSAEMYGLPTEHQTAIERVQAALAEAAFADAWAAGEALSADEAIEFGLAVAAQLQQQLATENAL